MAYRTAATPHSRVLELRPEPWRVTLGSFIVGGTFSAIALVVFVMAPGTLPLAIALTAAGAFLLWNAHRGLTTGIRLTQTAGVIIVEWRYRGKVERTERIDVAELVGVDVDELPISTHEATYRLVVRTRAGELLLAAVPAQDRTGYLAKRNELRAFLDIPAQLP